MENKQRFGLVYYNKKEIPVCYYFINDKTIRCIDFYDNTITFDLDVKYLNSNKFLKK